MKKLVLSGKRIITGAGALSCLREVNYKKIMIVTGGSSMEKAGVIKTVSEYLTEKERQICVYQGVQKNPTIQEVSAGVEMMKKFGPDCVLAIGGGSAMDCAKAMLLFYEFPEMTFKNISSFLADNRIPEERKTGLICVPSTSGTGSEVTRGTVITDTEEELKVPIMTDCLRPDIAILDPEITLTMPKRIVAETGMDALTHAIEAYTNHNLDDFDEALCRAAIEGIVKWLPVSYELGSIEAREKVHNYQAMAGIGFANVGLGMVHGIAHSFGAAFNMAHGLTNAIILPYVLKYNQRDPIVKEKLDRLSAYCRCDDLTDTISEMNKQMQIPTTFSEAGITKENYDKKYEMILNHAMLGATKVNPVRMTQEEMKKMLKAVYSGEITY